jgi:hypothetical protein
VFKVVAVVRFKTNQRAVQRYINRYSLDTTVNVPSACFKPICSEIIPCNSDIVRRSAVKLNGSWVTTYLVAIIMFPAELLDKIGVSAIVNLICCISIVAL